MEAHLKPADAASNPGLAFQMHYVIRTTGEPMELSATVREEQAQWLEREVYAVPTFYFQDRFPVLTPALRGVR